MRNEQDIGSRLVHARVQLLLAQPFFGSLCLRLKLQPGAVATMATDGRRIVYSPEFALKLSPQELEAVLAHEVMHCALGHHCRRGTREPGMWNRAADLAINPLLVANGFRLPAGALIDAAYGGMSAEEIYAELKRKEGAAASPNESSAGSDSGSKGGGNPGNPKAGQTNLSSAAARSAGSAGKAEKLDPSAEGGFGEVLDAVADEGQRASEAEKAEQQRGWSVAAEQAQRAAAACGRTAAGVERTLKQTRVSRQDWRAILRDFISAQAPQDYRWSPPNRRYVSAGLYLPSVHKTGLGEIVVAIDTSGSIRGRELEQFVAEIAAIAEEAQPERIHVVCADAAIQTTREFAAGEPIRIEMRGGGGTDFRPVFAWVEEQGTAPACLIYLTDLRCHSFPEAASYPVLWVTNSKRRAPMGETIKMERDEGV
jgi:predicted metal-dependent peptidase